MNPYSGNSHSLQVNMLRERNKSYGAIKFVDISSKDYSPEENQGLDYETVRITLVYYISLLIRSFVSSFHAFFELNWSYHVWCLKSYSGTHWQSLANNTAMNLSVSTEKWFWMLHFHTCCLMLGTPGLVSKFVMVRSQLVYVLLCSLKRWKVKCKACLGSEV